MTPAVTTFIGWLYAAGIPFTAFWLYLIVRDVVSEDPVHEADDAFVLAGLVVLLAFLWPVTCLAIIVGAEIVRARGGFREEDE